MKRIYDERKQFEIRESSVRKGIQNKKRIRNRFHKHFI
ncbi:cysteine ABC transporter permease [Bacillus toyonensis]|uniref:Cysteine ABC transporter permease n=1 Tax=Bacillus toyonensis TaxID=155322 RepID=A0A2A8HHC9_9BACI|nr:cysteine ABC transporter permease [Bacillus toyonensis]